MIKQETYIIQEYSTFRELFLGRVSDSYFVEDNKEDSAQSLWNWLCTDLESTETRKASFYDRFNGIISFYRTKAGVQVRILSFKPAFLSFLRSIFMKFKEF